MSLINHHSTEERCLGDCALGEGMYPQYATNDHFHWSVSYSSGAQKHIIYCTSLTITRCVHTDTHSDPSSVHPLINPVFLCGQSFEGYAGGQRAVSSLPS